MHQLLSSNDISLLTLSLPYLVVVSLTKGDKCLNCASNFCLAKELDVLTMKVGGWALHQEDPFFSSHAFCFVTRKNI